MEAVSLEGGFSEAPIQAAFAFRAVMNAMARPGRIETLDQARGPAPLSPAAATVILTLCDADTPVHLAPGHDVPAIRDWLAFHTGAPLCGPERATFAVGTWEALAPVSRFPVGTPEYPDRSATLILEMPEVSASGATLSGPGILGTASLSLPDLATFRDNARAFPLGLDFIFTAGNRVAALPRSTRVA